MITVMKIAMLSFVSLAQSQVLMYPGYRYIPFNELVNDERTDAAGILDYSETTWNLPGNNEVEFLCFDCLPPDQQEAAKLIGFPTETFDGDEVSDTWDCYVNHYYDFSWDRLASDEYDVAQYYETLGWSRAYWESSDPDLPPPTTESMLWEELSDNEREAADMLCYFQETR